MPTSFVGNEFLDGFGFYLLLNLGKWHLFVQINLLMFQN